ncbi:polysaccharide biosynthesis C-terminal domain-containing protein [Lactobacillus kalixensis]|uniref:Oligosaccharide repeat-containing polymerase n=1 Tax=Lactobacillus kalixensis DSM 16043 TaxID=1423763 RepID=A0A0R1U8L1_9LACO|nr:polysaccharide biosynthesis C-terminal domain-containing protein [Lactobacillus kalixensis]KRL89625.1 oligosaccharide repeat-containing polymerase [Lactobacillus kalixensis DSM 16043]
MTVVKNYLYNIGYQILAIIVPVITSAYIARVLKPEGVGANAFTNSIIQYFLLFCGLGIAYYGNRQVTYVRHNRSEKTQTFWELQVIRIVMTLLTYLVFVIFMMFYTRNKVYMWAQSINLIAIAFDITWYYQGIENFKALVLKNSIVKVLSMIAIFVLVKKPTDVTLYISILAISTLLGNLTLWPNLRKELTKINMRTLTPWIHVLPMIGLFIPQIASQIYGQLSKTMLGGMVSEVESGYFQYSDSLIRIVVALVTATGTVMLPHVSNIVSKGDLKQVNNLLYKSFNYVSGISFSMMFGLAAISLTLVPKYYGPGYDPVGPAMMIESIIIVMIAWNNAIGVQYLIPLNRVREYRISVIVGAVVNLIINIPFIHFWGLNGAMWSTVIAETTVTLYQLWCVRNSLSYRILFRGIWKYFISSVVMFIIVFWMSRNFAGTWMMMGIEVLVGIIIYCLLIIMFKAPIVIQVKDIISRKFSKKN